MFELNEEQRRAVDHGRSPLLVVAGAGSGKTGTLAHRLARILRDGADPDRVCLLTFSRRAAAELTGRAGRLSDPSAAGRVWGGTFHAVANRVLRLHGHRLGLDPGFSILDQADAVELFGLVRHDLGLGHSDATSSRDPDDRRVAGRRRFPRAATLASVYDRMVNAAAPLGAVLERWFPWCADEADGIRAVFATYTARKRERQLLDYDDLLLCWRALGEPLHRLFDHVLVDEYQDTNAVQADILGLLRPAGEGLTAVGDDAQAIYGFRAATSRNLAEFPARFPGTTVIRLEQNYRSTPPILAVANAVMAEARTDAALEKRLWSAIDGHRRPVLRTCGDESTEAEAVCDSVLAHRDDGVALNQQAVLFRAAHHADMLELALTRRNIPYVKYGGLRFLEAAHVKDLLALLRVLDNPADELAWFRVLRLLDGVGAATARRVMRELGLGPAGDGGAPVTTTTPAGGGAIADPSVTPLARLLAAAPRVPAAATAELHRLREALAACGGAGGSALPPAAEIGRLRQWLDPVVSRAYDSPAARVADLEQLERVASAATTRSRFVSDLTLDPPVSTSDLAGPPVLDEDWLVLSTVHSAKGGEWHAVHVIHASDGMFPSDLATGDADAIEEERRLLYVAVTRAKQVLEVNVPLRYYHRPSRDRDAHSYAQVSRFLTPAVRSLMDDAHVEGRRGLDLDDPRAGVTGEVGAPGGLLEVDQLLAGLWA